MIDPNIVASYCLREYHSSKDQLVKQHFVSQFDVDYEIRFVLFVASNIDGLIGDCELKFLRSVNSNLRWSKTYESLLQNKLEKQESFQLDDLKTAIKDRGFAKVLYRLAFCTARVDGSLSKDEKSLLGNLSDALLLSAELKGSLEEEMTTLFLNDFKDLPPMDTADADSPGEQKSLDECLEELNELVGLDNVKDEINKLVSYLKIQTMRKEHSLSETNLSLHMVFTGNPGTGKTTVARIVAEIYRAMGILKKGHLVETDRSGLVGKYVGHTEAKTSDVINQALDGVLFIDEAYSLVKNSENDFGQEAIDAIVKRMEDDRSRLVVIVAGYKEEMEGFINANPGLRSRFNTYIEFDDFSADELMKIIKMFCSSNDYELDDAAEAKLVKLFEVKTKELSSGFGNARFVRNLFEQLLRNHAFRLSRIEGDLSKKDLMTLHEQDIVI